MKPKLRLLQLLLIVILMSGAVSCGLEEKADFMSLDDQKWAYGDTLIFSGLADTSAVASPLPSHSLMLALRHTNAYPYRNIWIEAAYCTADSTRYTDTLSIELCDSYGRWLGKGIGDLFQQEAIISPTLNLLPGSDVSIRHIMRVDTLRGIERSGLFYSPLSSKK